MLGESAISTASVQRLWAQRHLEFEAALPTMRFVALASWLSIDLTPGQRTIANVAFDDTPPEDLGVAEKIFGGLFRAGPQARRISVNVCGRGSGKSYVLGALRLLHLALTVAFTPQPGEIASAMIVAPDMRLARATLRFVAGAMRRPLLAPYLVGETTTDRVTIRRPDDARINIECFPATAGGSALRGRPIVGALLEECAFFRDDNHAVNDAELLDAVQPRLLPGGQILCNSSPWVQSGILWDLYSANHGCPAGAIAAHAPTLAMRSDESTRAMVAGMYASDPDKAERECGARFLSAGTGIFFDPTAIQAMVGREHEEIVPHFGDQVIAAADFGFRVNASTLVIAIRRGLITFVVKILEIRPDPGEPLKPSVVCAVFAEECKRWGAGAIVADGHHRESVAEHLGNAGLSIIDAPVGPAAKAETHVATRTAMNEGRVRSIEHARLKKQLREIVGTPVAGGSISIKSPQWATGEHGDIASAFVLAVASVSGTSVEKIVDPLDRAAAIRAENDAMWAAKQTEYQRRKSEARDFDFGTTTLDDVGDGFG